MTGESHTGVALLAPDRARACQSRENMRQAVRELTGWARFVRTASARFGYDELCSAEDCAAVCRDADVQKLLRPCKGPWLYLSLETHWRGACLDEFPSSGVLPLIDLDRNGPLPFIQRQIWAVFTSILSRRFQNEPSVCNEKAALGSLNHYAWRLEQVDAVWVPQSRNSSRVPQLCMRAGLQDSRSYGLKWRATGGDILTVPNQEPLEVCSTETLDVVLESEITGHLQWYSSRTPVHLQGAKLWQKRRAEAVVFPDYDGSSSTTTGVGDPPSAVESSSSDEEDATGAVSQPCPDATGTIERSALEATPAIPGNLSIMEHALVSLPDGFRYVPRILDGDAAGDDIAAIASANACIVAGFVARSGRRVRRRTGAAV